MRAFAIAENIVNGYNDRARAASREAWLKDNKELGDLLFRAQRLYDGTTG